MKGAGGSWGFQAITDIGAALEQAAEGADSDASRKWVGELSKYLDRVEMCSSIIRSASWPLIAVLTMYCSASSARTINVSISGWSSTTRMRN